MRRYSAERYLLLSVRLPRDQVAELLDEAERAGKAEALWEEGRRYPGVTDVRATVIYDASKGEAWEVHRPGFSHGMHYNYLDDLHPVECTECYCRHHRHNGRSSVLRGDPPSACQCGHLTARHRFREVRETMDICKAPETWFTEDMRTFNALARIGARSKRED